MLLAPSLRWKDLKSVRGSGPKFLTSPALIDASAILRTIA